MTCLPAAPDERRHGGRRCQRADRPGPARLGQGLGAGRALEARERRQDQPDALAPLRGGRRRGLREDDQRLQAGDRRRRRGDQRVVRGHPAEGLGCRQHRPGPRHGVGPLFAAAPVPGEVHGHDRRRQLPRQEVRRLGAGGGGLRQVRQQVDRHSGRDHRRPDELPHLLDGEGRLQGIPEGHRGLPRTLQGAEEEQHAGRLRARSRLGRRQHLAALGAVGARRQPGRQERQGHHQLAGDREGARIRQGAVRDLHPRHGVVERLLQQQDLRGRATCTSPRTASRST